MKEYISFEVILLIALLIALRFFYLIHKITTGWSRIGKKRQKPAKTLICIGSGGHTTEMLALLQTIDFEKYSPRLYITAKSDTASCIKIREFEGRKSNIATDYRIIQIPRSRVVHQSYFTSIFTTIYSILYSIPIVCLARADLVLCNGPGTCVPICVIAFVLRAVFVCESRIVFVESFCRTKTFSLSGKILVYIADNFLVQWPHLQNKLRRADYIGQLL